MIKNKITISQFTSGTSCLSLLHPLMPTHNRCDIFRYNRMIPDDHQRTQKVKVMQTPSIRWIRHHNLVFHFEFQLCRAIFRLLRNKITIPV